MEMGNCAGRPNIRDQGRKERMEGIIGLSCVYQPATLLLGLRGGEGTGRGDSELSR
jgi:hypothetical protein